MPVVFARIRVGDFDRWKTAFDSHEPYRREQGITLKAIYRDASYWNGILVILEAEDVEKAQTYYSSDEQRQRMSQSGLERPAELWIGSDVLG